MSSAAKRAKTELVPQRGHGSGAAASTSTASSTGAAPEVFTLSSGPSELDGQAATFLEMWRAGELCDVTVLVGGEQFRAHRLILAAGSSYMRARFRSDMKDGGIKPQIELVDVPARAFRSVLEFLYTQTCEVTSESLVPTMQAASRLEVSSLLVAGGRFLESQLTAENACAYWTGAVELGRPIELAPVVDACQACIHGGFSIATNADAFLALPAALLDEILQSNEICAEEVDVFRALMRWERAQPRAHDGDRLAPLLQRVRFKLISPLDLAETVKGEPLVSDRADLKEALVEAFSHHALPIERREEVVGRGIITWNPDDRHEWVQLSSDLLEVSFSGDEYQEDLNGLARATKGWSSGRHYFEFWIPAECEDPKGEDGCGYPSVGVIARDVPLGGDTQLVIGGSHGRGWGWYTFAMSKVHATDHHWSTPIADEARHKVGARTCRYGVLLDIERRTLELYIDGELQVWATHTDVECDAPLFAAVEAGTLASRSFRFNFTATPPPVRELRVI